MLHLNKGKEEKRKKVCNKQALPVFSLIYYVSITHIKEPISVQVL
jgi:hypothetical protein